ncbi:hypothetical protein BTVI_133745 [Pitangus sulphuratus]|nr:hypothetical protein BTVI_133745 [Pitangus sulphuratus]
MPAKSEEEGRAVAGALHFDAAPDAQTLYKAMKGLGTDEQAIIDVLTKRSNIQRQEIAKSFKAQFGKDLIESLKSELSGNFERLIVALMYPPFKYDAKELYDAMKGVGTNEGVIIEILASRTKAQIKEIIKAYKEEYGSDLEEDIKSETSGYLEQILVCLLQGERDNATLYVDTALALQDAETLYAAGEKIRGTDEIQFITILCKRSATHLLKVFEEYQKLAGKSIEDSIKSETRGSLEDAMLAIVKCTRNIRCYFAERLYHALKGAGTDDGTLIRVIVSRSEVDLNLIKPEFKRIAGKSLSSMILELDIGLSGELLEKENLKRSRRTYQGIEKLMTWQAGIKKETSSRTGIEIAAVSLISKLPGGRTQDFKSWSTCFMCYNTSLFLKEYCSSDLKVTEDKHDTSVVKVSDMTFTPAFGCHLLIPEYPGK